MKWTRWTSVGSSLAVLALSAATFSCSSQPAGRSRTAAASMTKTERGAYLATIMGCNDCHTPGAFYGAADTTRLLSGSELGWVGPWGTTYATNLTTDPETGIGQWSEDDIVKALRTGQRPDGSPILPPMPWPNLASLTDEDAHALAAYLKSLQPVRHKVPDRLGPGKKAAGSAIMVPPPPAWDAPKGPPPGAPGGGGAAPGQP